MTGSDRDGASPERLERVALAVDTLVVLMPLTNLEAICARLAAALVPGRPAALVASASLAGQEVVRAPVSRMARAAAEAGIGAPATLVVGEVVDAVPAERVREMVTAAGPSTGVEEVGSSASARTPSRPHTPQATRVGGREAASQQNERVALFLRHALFMLLWLMTAYAQGISTHGRKRALES